MMEGDSVAFGVALRLGVAALGGLAVGIEREWSTRARARPPRFAGVRTFFLLGLLGGLAGELHRSGHAAAGIAILASACVLVLLAYAISARAGDVDGTTEVSALVVLAAGVIAATGRLALASALFAITALVLVEKSRIHGLVYRLQSDVLEAAARFAVLALVILPLVPEGPFGPPPGIRPRELWILVLLFSGLSFAGFLALRALGPGRGYALAGLLGGLVSSTAVTLSFSRESERVPELGRALALGVIAASTVLVVRVGVLAGALYAPLAAAALRFLLPLLAAGVVLCVAMVRESGRSETAAPLPGNPLGLGSAIQMAALFQVVLYAVSWSAGRFGDQGLLASAALVGLTDMDALTYSMVKLGREQLAVSMAARALGVGVLANTLLKLVLALTIGRGRFRTAAGVGLGVLALVGAAALALG
jgi:uncharacterized membrane protein (DUF4010 family)